MTVIDVIQEIKQAQADIKFLEEKYHDICLYNIGIFYFDAILQLRAKIIEQKQALFWTGLYAKNC